MEPVVYYGQNREDLIIASFFPDIKKGFYVDVGAHHPTEDSVTKYFYDKGWSGVNFEPQLKLFELTQKQRKRDINLNVAVADKKGSMILRSYESSGLSTLSGEMKKGYKKSNPQMNYEDVEVEVVTLASVFEKNGVGEIHFLKIDVEGFEYEVLSGNNWKKYRPELICIESNHQQKDWHEILGKENYTLVYFDGLNEYFLDRKSLHRLDIFKQAFPELLVSGPVISFGWKKKIDQHTEKLEEYQNMVDGQRAIIEQLQQELEEERQKIKSIRFLSHELASQAKSRIKKK